MEKLTGSKRVMESVRGRVGKLEVLFFGGRLWARKMRGHWGLAGEQMDYRATTIFNSTDLQIFFFALRHLERPTNFVFSAMAWLSAGQNPSCK